MGPFAHSATALALPLLGWITDGAAMAVPGLLRQNAWLLLVIFWGQTLPYSSYNYGKIEEHVVI